MINQYISILIRQILQISFAVIIYIYEYGRRARCFGKREADLRHVRRPFKHFDRDKLTAGDPKYSNVGKMSLYQLIIIFPPAIF